MSSSIRVGFDISQVAHHGGVSRYTDELAHQLQKNTSLDPVFFYSSLRKPYQGDLKPVKKYKLPPTAFEILFNKFRMVPIERFIGKVDIFHSSDWIQPKTSAIKVTTFHDVVPLKYPQWSDPKVVAVHQRRVKIVEQEIDMVIAVSEATKKDLLEMTKIPEEKIKVIYEGVDKNFGPRPKEDVEKFRKKYNLPDKFILAIGGVGERRNLKGIVAGSQGYSLVTTGRDLPFIPDQEMPLLYGAADLLLYPSFYEGFGLPVLEAMACGTPVITSNLSSLPEVAGDAAILVDPNNHQEIQSAVKRIMTDKEFTKKLIEKGFKQSKKFSWDICGKQTIELYNQLISKR